jgi:hypothetical protein
VFSKKLEDKATGLIVVLYFPQTWWPYLMNLLVQNPEFIPRQNMLILQANPEAIHPLSNKLELRHLLKRSISEGASSIIM